MIMIIRILMIDNDKNHIDNDGGDYVSSFLE